MRRLRGPYGTWGYRSPEQAKPPYVVDTRADVWAFGAICIDVVCGSTGGLVRQADPDFLEEMEPWQISAHLPPDCDETLQLLILCCCQPNPNNRPSWEGIREVLAGLDGDDGGESADWGYCSEGGATDDRGPVFSPPGSPS